jgi:hypothetical protein
MCKTYDDFQSNTKVTTTDAALFITERTLDFNIDEVIRQACGHWILQTSNATLSAESHTSHFYLKRRQSWIRQRERHTRSTAGLSRYESCDPQFHIPVQISIYRRSRIHHLAELCKMAESYVMIRQHKLREKGRDLLRFVGFSFTEKFLTFIHKKKRNIRIKSIFCKYRIHFWYVRWRTGLRLMPTARLLAACQNS